MRAIRRSVLGGLAAGALMVAMLPGAAAADDPIGGCPKGTFNVPHPEGDGWGLAPAEDPQALNKDRNGDGWICVRLAITQSKKHRPGVWVVKDNTRKWGRYQIVPENGIGTWPEAAAHCESMGAHLVTIDSAKEDRAVFRLEPDTWLGATDEAVEGTWTWVTGEPFTYTNWAPGEPNDADGEEHHAAYAWDGSGTWIDLPGWVSKSFVCEYE